MASSRIKVKLNRAGINRMLREQFAPAVNRVADAVAHDANEDLAQRYPDGDSRFKRGFTPHAKVKHEVTDRTRSVVAIAHPAGKNIEAKHGVLTKAAAAHGLEVHE